MKENTLKFNSKIIKLLLGKTVDFYENEIIELVKMIASLNINTLSIQYSTYGFYECKVDNKTLEYYKNKK